MIELLNVDCMDYMKNCKDKQFDLAIVDPEFGIGIGHSPRLVTDKGLKAKNWDDKTIDMKYFDELFRVSKNQIIWGGNYFGLPAHRTFVVWDKMTYITTMSQVELAWTSFDSPARYVKINSNQLDRFHPTQKPVKLYNGSGIKAAINTKHK